ncbi:MAG: hypothetical protein WC379_06685 [Methanoregula sp.]|jgi:hypothetical protein
MDDVLITEHAGTRRDAISRFYQYGSGGVRVLDTRKTIKRLYLFDPASDIMTERDPRRQDKILRRFVFDKYGMLEESFAFGVRPRTFRYENGARQIAVREGGDYGAVGKIITFEPNGITETAWGRNGEIEHVYQFDPKGDAITVRAGGWYGDVERTIVFASMGASLFLEPEAFLQFLMFTEWSEQDRDEEVNERVAEIRGSGTVTPGGSPFAYTGNRRTSADTGASVQRGPALRTPAPGKKVQTTHTARDDPGIDFIPAGDSPAVENSRKQVIFSRQSRDISYQERRDHDKDGGGSFSRGRSAEIPLEERFGSAGREHEPLSRGKSADISLDERFESAQKERGTLSRGSSADIPLDERFENAQKDRGKLPRGRSVDIPYDERRGNSE